MSYDYAIGLTEYDDCKRAYDNRLDVVRQIGKAIETDDENDSMYLLNMYMEATETERALMDAMLICICGWCMETIISQSKPMED